MTIEEMRRWKMLARQAANDAIRAGRLTRGRCEMLSSECAGFIQAHHDDYSRPLDVRWVCRKHHLKIDAHTMSRRQVSEPRFGGERPTYDEAISRRREALLERCRRFYLARAEARKYGQSATKLQPRHKSTTEPAASTYPVTLDGLAATSVTATTSDYSNLSF